MRWVDGQARTSVGCSKQTQVIESRSGMHAIQHTSFPLEAGPRLALTYMDSRRYYYLWEEPGQLWLGYGRGVDFSYACPGRVIDS
jgi:hypothetical protein